MFPKSGASNTSKKLIYIHTYFRDVYIRTPKIGPLQLMETPTCCLVLASVLPEDNLLLRRVPLSFGMQACRIRKISRRTEAINNHKHGIISLE